jgi:hypothetical protein
MVDVMIATLARRPRLLQRSRHFRGKSLSLERCGVANVLRFAGIPLNL